MVPVSLHCPFLIAPNIWFDILQRLFILYWPFYQPCISMKYLTQLIRLLWIISIPSKFYYFRPLDHMISMECSALDFRCQCTQQKLQSICAVLTFDPQGKKKFYKRQISIKLFYLYQRLQCRENYFFKIKFGFFLYLLLSALRKENDLLLYISDIRQIVGYRTPIFIQPFPWRLHITITFNLPNLRLWYSDVVTVIAWKPEVVCRTFQMSRHEKDETRSELTWFETTV
jgi:hypothetical protein